MLLALGKNYELEKVFSGFIFFNAKILRKGQNL